MSHAAVKILAVDDTPSNLFAIRALLEPEGHQVVEARSGAEAVEIAVRGDFAVVLLDLMMPDMDGLETLSRLRAVGVVPETPVIVITAADGDIDTIERAYELGAVDFLSKPIASRLLRGKVAAFAELYRVSKALRDRDAELAVKNRHIAVLAHDLRNPLNTVVVGTQLLLRLDLPAAARRTQERIARAADRMSEMVQDLLEQARVGSGTIPLDRASVDVGALCRELVEEFETVDQLRRIDLVIEGDVQGEWDGPRLYQALSNLVRNATEHGRGEAKIHVLGREADVEISVFNGGQPIAPELIPVLFEPFLRGREDGKGLGLGLYIVDAIARAHGGDVSASSSAEHGTTFRLRIPRPLHAAGRRSGEELAGQADAG